MFDVITIGTATQDVYLISKRFRVVRDPHFTQKTGFPAGEAQCFTLGGKVEVDDMVITTGGGATNAAATFSRQGFRTACIAKIGDDIFGKIIENELRHERITPLLARDKILRTAYSVILLTHGGERTILVYRGASETLKAGDIPWNKLKAGWAYIAAGGIGFPLLKRLTDFLRSRGTLIALNPGKAQLVLGLKRLAPVIAKTKVFIVNREEASRLTGVSYSDEKGIFARLDRAVGGILVVTDAKRGSRVSDGHMLWRAGTFRERRLIDRTGAGDSFGAGFVAGLMHRGERCEKGSCRPANVEYAMRLATANAASNIESIGAKSGLLTKDEFLQPRWSRFKVRSVVL